MWQWQESAGFPQITRISWWKHLQASRWSVCIVPATQIQSGLLCKQTTGHKRCKPDKKQSFNAHQCTKFMQCRALHSIGRNRWSCVSEQLFFFFGSCSPSYEQTMNPHMPNGLPFFVVILVELHGAPNFFLHIDHSQHTPHATAAWIGSDMGRMRNIDLQQVYNLQCYTAFTDKNMGSTSGTIVTYQRWIAKPSEGLIHPRCLPDFFHQPSATQLILFIFTYIYIYAYLYICLHIYI